MSKKILRDTITGMTMAKNHLTIVNTAGGLSMIKTVHIAIVGAAGALPMMRT